MAKNLGRLLMLVVYFGFLLFIIREPLVKFELTPEQGHVLFKLWGGDEFTLTLDENEQVLLTASSEDYPFNVTGPMGFTVKGEPVYNQPGSGPLAIYSIKNVPLTYGGTYVVTNPVDILLRGPDFKVVSGRLELEDLYAKVFFIVILSALVCYVFYFTSDD